MEHALAVFALHEVLPDALAKSNILQRILNIIPYQL